MFLLGVLWGKQSVSLPFCQFLKAPCSPQLVVLFLLTHQIWLLLSQPLLLTLILLLLSHEDLCVDTGRTRRLSPSGPITSSHRSLSPRKVTSWQLLLGIRMWINLGGLFIIQSTVLNMFLLFLLPFRCPPHFPSSFFFLLFFVFENLRWELGVHALETMVSKGQLIWSM